jgi:nitrilase
VIVSPLGEVLAGPDTSGEAIVRADLDLAQIAEGKYDLDAVGHYARPDIFQLSVNERPMQSVVTQHGESTQPIATSSPRTARSNQQALAE